MEVFRADGGTAAVMAELVCAGVSTDGQGTLRQTHLLTGAGLVAGVQGV